MIESERIQKWKKTRIVTPEKLAVARVLLLEIKNGKGVLEAARSMPMPDGSIISKAGLVAAYTEMVANGTLPEDIALLEKIRMKPVRTLSGVTTVTVLTKPYPCPGKCIFCPTDVRMPKSYLPDEPGAMRALDHEFDPYTQVRSRINALDSLGHPTDKIELLILGGTWSAYRKDYQEWFIKRCFEAMNHAQDDPSRESPTLRDAQTENETAPHRNVGLVIETRPDEITPTELVRLRMLGVTKVQMGAQSMDDAILEANRRGHTVAQTIRAVALLRAAGFKIVLHWMPNLHTATPESDRLDFARIWEDACPDELKIYPNQLLANAELYQVWQQGLYTPYTTQQLIDLIVDIKPTVPRYCRINRVIRDIPSNNVVEGNRRTSLRQDVQAELARRGQSCQCIRCREVRSVRLENNGLSFDDMVYSAGGAEEHFLSFNTSDDKLAGFLRLSFPGESSPDTAFEELQGAALIREVHVYGQSLPVGGSQDGLAQHSGLGTALLQKAAELAVQNGFKKIAVISAVGTRKYYLDRGFNRGNYYLIKKL